MDNNFESRDGTGNLGKDYEYVMAAYYSLILSLNDSVVDFCISTNNDATGDFDDIVLEVQLANSEEHIFAMQLKHKDRPIALIKLTADHGDFSLTKYAKEFAKVRLKHPNFHQIHFILFTNSKLAPVQMDTRLIKEIGKERLTISSDFTISQKNIDGVAEELGLNLNDTHEFLYKFSSDSGGIEHDFFQQFSFYTRQKNAREVEILISSIISEKFPNCSDYLVVHYLNYFKYWCRRDYGIYKLTKRDIRLKLAEYLLRDHVPEMQISESQSFDSETLQLIRNLIFDFDLYTMEDYTDDINNKLMGAIFREFKELSIDRTHQLFDLNVEEFLEMYDTPLSANDENFRQLTLKRLYLIFWHMSKHPLVVKVDKQQPAYLNSAIKLCNNRGDPKCLIIVGANLDIDESLVDQRIFRNLYDLHETCYYKGITEKCQMSLQGRPPISLKHLSDSQELMKAVTLQELLLMLGSHFTLGTSDDLPPHYIQRFLYKIILKKEVIDEVEEDLFVLTLEDNDLKIHENFESNLVDLDRYLTTIQNGTDYVPVDVPWSTLKRSQHKKLNFAILTNRKTLTFEEFKEICLKNACKNCHHVHVMNEHELEWLQTSGTIQRLRPYHLDNEEKLLKDSEMLCHTYNKVNIICADSGMGKSSLLKFLKQTCPSRYWVMRITLHKHLEFFQEEHGHDTILEYFSQFEGEGKFVQRLISALATTKQIQFLWDGFDEIPENCHRGVISTIRQLDGYFHWITSRSECQNLLEDAFGTFALTLRQLDQKDQYDYIFNRISTKFDEATARQIFDKITTSLKGSYFDYSGIPLHLEMLVDVFKHNPSKYIENSNIISLVDVFDKFVKGKVRCVFEKAEADFDNYWMQEIQDEFTILTYQHYENAAIKATLDQATFTDLNIFYDEGFEDLVVEDMVGIISGRDGDGKPRFVYKAYEEFLAASWIASHHHKHPKLLLLLYEERFRNVRLMFDIILARDSPIHIATIYQRLNILQEHRTEIADCKDGAGRNPLQVACSWGTKYRPIEIFNASNEIEDDIIEEPTDHDWKVFNFLLDHLCLPQECDLELPHPFLTCINQDPKRFAQVFKTMLPKDESISSRSKFDRIHFNLSRHNCEKCAILLLRIWNKTSNCATNVGDIVVTIENASRTGEGQPYIEVLEYLMTHGCDPLQRDDVLKWNSFDYADRTLSLSAIDSMLNHRQIAIESLNNYNDIPTLLHYCAVFSYNNLLKIIKKIPFMVYETQDATLLQTAVAWNNLPLVSKLLEFKEYQEAINRTNQFNGNCLCSAAHVGNLDMIKLLLKHGAKITKTVAPPLIGAVIANSPNLCLKLLEFGADIHEKSPDGECPVTLAAACRNFDVVKFLVEHGADVNSTYYNLLSLLDACILGRSLEHVKLLVSYGCDVNKQCSRLGYTPLRYACEFGDVQLTRFLLESGADVNIKCKNLNTPLHAALLNRNEEVALELIKAKPQGINDANIEGFTPIQLAALHNHPKVIDALKNEGAVLNEKTHCSLHIAVHLGFDQCVLSLIKAGANVNQINKGDRTPLVQAVNSLPITLTLLDHGAEVNLPNKDGLTVLHIAAHHGILEVVMELSRRGASVNALSNSGQPPLYFAMRNESLEVVNWFLEHSDLSLNSAEVLCNAVLADAGEYVTRLLDCGFNVNSNNSSGYGPLYYAVNNSYNCVKLLLDRGADPNIFYDGRPCLTHAVVRQSKISVIQQLLAAGANSDGVLHYAACRGDIAVLILLLKAGAVVDEVDDDGQTALHCTCISPTESAIADIVKICDDDAKVTGLHFHYNVVDCAKELIVNGADVNTKDKEGKTPLHLACKNHRPEIVEILLRHGADVDMATVDNQTALHMVAISGFLDIAEMLIAKGARVDSFDKYHRTSLGHAVANNHEELVRLLLRSGANPDYYEDEYPKTFTPLLIACDQNNVKMMELLTEYGADLNREGYKDKESTSSIKKAPQDFSLKQIEEQVARIVERLLRFEDPLLIKFQELLLADQNKQIVNTETHAGTLIVTPLIMAVIRGSEATVELLIQKGAGVNHLTSNGHRPMHFALYSESITMVKILISHGCLERLEELTVDADETSNNVSFLALACQRNFLEAVELFINSGMDVNCPFGNSPLYNAVSSSSSLEIIELLVNNGADINAATVELGIPPLHRAAELNRLDILAYLHENGAVLDVEDREKFTALHRAAREGHKDIVAYLIQHGVDVNKTTMDGNTPLSYACDSNFLEITTMLLKAGANINIQDSKGQSPLHLACARGHLETCQILLEHNARLDVVIKANGHTPFHSAIGSRNHRLLSVLISKGAVIDSEAFLQAVLADSADICQLFMDNGGIFDNDDQLHLQLISMQGPESIEILKKLLGYGLNPNATIEVIGNKYPVLQMACAGERLAYVEILLNNGADVDAIDHIGITSLIVAAQVGNLTVAKVLVDHGADINRQSDAGKSAFFEACGFGNLDFVQFLREKGADVFVVDQEGESALFPVNSKHTSLNIVEYLINCGLQVNHRNKQGWTPLHIASVNNNYTGAKFLLQNGAEVDATTEINLTPLQMAVRNGHVTMAELLISYNADVMIVAKDSGCTAIVDTANYVQPKLVELFVEQFCFQEHYPMNGIKDNATLTAEWTHCLMVATCRNAIGIIQYLIENKIVTPDAAMKDSFLTAMHVACKLGNIEIVLYLIPLVENINVQDCIGCTPLKYSTYGGHLHIVEVLIENGADIEGLDKHGNSCLYTAAAYGFLDIVRVLHDRGASIHVVDADGDTPLHDAASHGHGNIVSYLIENGADINYRNLKGQIPLDLAVENGHEEVAEILRAAAKA